MAKIILESGSTQYATEISFYMPFKSTYWPLNWVPTEKLVENPIFLWPIPCLSKMLLGFCHWLLTTYLFPIPDSVFSLRYLTGWKVNTLKFFKWKACLHYNLKFVTPCGIYKRRMLNIGKNKTHSKHDAGLCF